MDIKSSQALANRMFKTFKDAVSASSYKSFNNQAADYDPDAETITDDSTVFPVDVIILSFSFSRTQSDFLQIDGQNVLQKDRKGIVKYTSFPEGTKPESDDILTTIIDNVSFNIVGVNYVPMKSIYLLHLRPIEE